ncbi:MAG TPA: ATP-binding protein [Chthoniobacterales bacterium]
MPSPVSQPSVGPQGNPDEASAVPLSPRIEEQLRQAVEQVPDFAVFAQEPDGCVSSWNAGAERLFGYTPAEIVGRNVRILFTSEDQASGQAEAELAQAAETGRAEDERWHRRKDGSRLYLSGVTTAVRDDQGQLLGFVKMARDLTERQRLEEALQATDRRKDEFLAMLAHELRNPLASATGALALLDEAGAAPEARAWALEALKRQTGQLTQLVDDLLDVSRIQSGKIRLRKVRLDAAEVLDRAAQAVQLLAEARGHDLRRDYPHGVLTMEADPARLEQVLANLLTNAVKFTDPGGRIELIGRHDGNWVEIMVRDNGTGMVPERIPTLFGLFVQSDCAIARSQGGLGVGLSIALRLVELHSGTLSARSEGLGRGSAFTVRLPAAASSRDLRGPSREPSRTESAGPGPAHGRAKVLVVEDNRDLAMGLRLLLELKGYVVQVAHDGLEALEAARRFRPAAVLADLGLPGMDGYELAKRLRTEPWGAGALLVALSGYGREEDRQRALAAGFDRHLTKPVDPRVIEAVLARTAGNGA